MPQPTSVTAARLYDAGSRRRRASSIAGPIRTGAKTRRSTAIAVHRTGSTLDDQPGGRPLPIPVISTILYCNGVSQLGYPVQLWRMTELGPAWHELASVQHGVVTRRQATVNGPDSNKTAVAQLVRRGTPQACLSRSVFFFAAAPLSWRSRLMAATSAGGGSHATRTEHFGLLARSLDRDSMNHQPIEVTVARARCPARDDIIVHRWTDPTPRDSHELIDRIGRLGCGHLRLPGSARSYRLATVPSRLSTMHCAGRVTRSGGSERRLNGCTDQAQCALGCCYSYLRADPSRSPTELAAHNAQQGADRCQFPPPRPVRMFTHRTGSTQRPTGRRPLPIPTAATRLGGWP